MARGSIAREAANVAAVALWAVTCAVTAHAQVQQLERVEITGSSIKRVQIEGALPVEVYSRTQIERTGATSLNELLRSIPTIDILDQGELGSASPTASGTARIRLRGFIETDVLVLLNGRRMPINGLYDANGSGASVDINMIPLSAIDRIEILRDGASAIYGADALAGVVNFITRSNYTGFEARAGYGSSSQGGGTEKSGGLTIGHGDYDRDGFNLLASVDLFKRDPILRRERDISRSADFTRFGGPDARSGFSPFGNLLDGQGAPTGATVRPCPPDLYAGICRYDFNADLVTAYNGADRVSGMLVGSMKLPRGMRLSSEVLLSHAQDSFDQHPVPDVFQTPGGDSYLGRFMQGGTRVNGRKSDLSHVTVALEGNAQSFDWTVDAGQGRSKVVNDSRNYFDAAGYRAATGSGAIDPTVTTNDPALIESLKVQPRREGTSTMTFINGKITGEVGRLRGGAASYALGASLWRERLSDVPDALTQAGQVIGSIQQSAVSAERKIYAVFGELVMPVTKSLETQLALRYDHYPEATSTSPKVAARYVVSPQLSLRGSYTRSFRAPSLKQMFGSREEGAANFTSDALCAASGQPAGCTLVGFQVQGANANLKPEKGKTFNLGVIVEPMSGLSASLDWWRVNVDDAIDTPSIDQAVASGNFGRDAAGRIIVETVLKNFAKKKNEGLDLDVRWRLPLRFGTLTVRNGTTYYIRQSRFTDAATGWEEFNATYAKPRWRNVMTATLDTGPWSATMAMRTTGGFYDTDEPNPDTSTTPTVPSYTEIDLNASYAGVKGFKITAGVKNVANKTPPFSLQNTLSGQYSQMGFAELYTSRGRFIYGAVSYSFW